MNQQRILITGAASGLGRALAEHYAGRGARVLAGDVDEQRGQAFQAEYEGPGEVVFRKLDVRADADFEAARDWLREHWGGLDVLVNNAGVAAFGAIDAMSMDDWQWLTEINLLGVARGCHVLTPLLKEQGSAHVINIASMAGLANAPMMSAYNASKAGVIGLSETLRWELGAWGIGVTVVCPSFFRTRLGETLRSPDPDIHAQLDKLMSASEIDASDVARMTTQAADAGRFLLIPHREARRARWFKRWLPLLFNKSMRKRAAVARRRGQGNANE